MRVCGGCVKEGMEKGCVEGVVWRGLCGGGCVGGLCRGGCVEGVVWRRVCGGGCVEGGLC